jgi:hypothetical protein
MGGVYRVETLGTVRVALSPEIAELLGRSVGIDAVYRVNYLPMVTAGLTYKQRRTSYSLNYTQGASPGNGIYLTSAQRTLSTGLSYSGLRKIAIGMNVGYTEYGSLYQNIFQKYRNVQGGVGLNYYLMRNVSITANYDARRYQAGNLNRLVQIASVGLTWSPNRIPVSIW